MLRLDKTSQMKLQQFISHFGTSKANIIRQLLIHATIHRIQTEWTKGEVVFLLHGPAVFSA
jgi:hypothetical protein